MLREISSASRLRDIELPSMLGLDACCDVVERQTQQQGRVCDDTTNTVHGQHRNLRSSPGEGLERESFLLRTHHTQRRLYMADTTKLALALLDPPHVLSDRPRGDAVKLLVRDSLQILLP